MGAIKFKSKKHLESGKIEWTYVCTCATQPPREIKVICETENEANAQAQFDCEIWCDENGTGSKM